MNGYMISIMSLIALVSVVAMFWYLFQTLRIMWGYSALVAIAAVLFSPLVHIVFYLLPKDGFDKHERLLFKRYFLSLAAIVVLGVFAAVAIPSLKSSQDEEMYYSDNLNTTEYNTADDIAANEKAAELHSNTIYQAHPDAEDIAESYAFEFWQQGKTEGEKNEIARVLREGTAPEVVYIISLFKKETRY